MADALSSVAPTPTATPPAALKDGEQPKAVSTPDQAAAPKPIDPIETELAEKYGERFTGLADDMRAQVVAAEKKGRDADRRYQAVAKLQKDHELTQRQAGQLLDLVASDPEAVFSNPALMKRLNRAKLEEFAEKIVWEKVQNERMDPRDRELRDLRAERAERLAAEKAKQEADEKEQSETKMKEDVATRRAYWEREIIGVLKNQGIEADSAFVAQMARYIQASRRANKPVDLPRIVAQVQQDFNQWQMRYLMSGFKPRQEGESNEAFAQRYEQFLGRVNPQLVELIRSGDLAKLKHKNMGRPAGSTKTEPKPEGNGKMTMTEWLEKRQARLGRK